MNYDDARQEISNLATWEQDQAHALSMIEPHLVYGGAVLDYGCGVGRIMKPLARKHTRTVFYGYDINSDYLELAAADKGKNEVYRVGTKWTTPQFVIVTRPDDLRSVFSVITFQHMPDDQVRHVIGWAYPARLRFQFAVGNTRMEYNWQRTPEEVEDWCLNAGYKVDIEKDPEYPTWRWVTAR